MSPAAYNTQNASIEKALKLARENNDLATMLADFTTRVRLLRLQYTMRTATLAS
jgi:hypothetical protein